MSNTIPQAALEAAAVRYADGLCERLNGERRRTESIHAQASIADGERELHLWGYERARRARISIQGQLPEGWTDLEVGTPPEITVADNRTIEAVSADVTRRLLPILESEIALVQAALDEEAAQEEARSRVLDYFLELMPGSERSHYYPNGTAHSRGPDMFTTELRVGLDASTADLHLRNAPAALIPAVAALIALERDENDHGEPGIASHPAIDDLADAVTAFANAHKLIAPSKLLRDTALNVLILSRIASNRLDDHRRREQIDATAHRLVTELRHAAWELPTPPGPTATPTER